MARNGFEEVSIEYLNVNFVVSGYYIAGESAVFYYADGSGYPGSSSEFEIEEILIGEQNVYDVLDQKVIDRLTELAIEKLEE